MSVTIGDIEAKMAARLSGIRDNFVSLLPEHLGTLGPILQAGLNEDLTRDEAAAMTFVAHKVKGTAATLGFRELGQKAETLEKLAQDLGAQPEYHPAIKHALEDFVSAAQQVIKDHFAAHRATH